MAENEKAIAVAEKKEQPPVKDTPENGTFKVDVDHWKTRELRVFQRAGLAGDFEQQILLSQAAIKEWPYEGSPSDDEAWDELHPKEMQTALRAVSREADNFFRT